MLRLDISVGVEVRYKVECRLDMRRVLRMDMVGVKDGSGVGC